MNGAAVDRPAGRREGLVRIVGYATLGGQRTETAMPNWNRVSIFRYAFSFSSLGFSLMSSRFTKSPPFLGIAWGSSRRQSGYTLNVS